MDNISNTKQTELRKVQTIHGERSFILCLPKDFIAELKIAKGDYVICKIVDNSLVVKKADLQE
jgi:hypothetical protein